MEYSKSEVRKLKKLIDEDILKLEYYTKLYIPDPLTGLADLCIADLAVTELDAHLKCIKEHIENTDNYNLAVEIEGKVTPVWGKYIEKVTNEDEIQRLRTMPGHLHFSSIRDTMLDWLDWLDEYEAEHPKQQDTPTASPSAKEEKEDKTQKGIIDKESLKTLFVGLFFADDYYIQDTHDKSRKKSRFDKLCQRLEMVLEGNDKELMPNNTNIGAIAYMIYCSPFTRAEYHKPKREGKKGCFSNLINTFFDIVGKDHPSDTRPNKYKPTQNVIDCFGDILKWE